jgi:hypothetical protein
VLRLLSCCCRMLVLTLLAGQARLSLAISVVFRSIRSPNHALVHAEQAPAVLAALGPTTDSSLQHQVARSSSS